MNKVRERSLLQLELLQTLLLQEPRAQSELVQLLPDFLQKLVRFCDFQLFQQYLFVLVRLFVINK